MQFFNRILLILMDFGSSGGAQNRPRRPPKPNVFELLYMQQISHAFLSICQQFLIICGVIGVVICLPIVGFLLFVIGLSCFHMYIKMRGKTTREFLKKKESVMGDKLGNDWFKFNPPFLNYSYKLSSEQESKLKTWKFEKGG